MSISLKLLDTAKTADEQTAKLLRTAAQLLDDRPKPPMYVPDLEQADGWYERQCVIAHEEIRRWPESMRGENANDTFFYTLWDHIVMLHKQGAYHKKRGFSLADVSAAVACNHLIEESVELQAEIMCGTKENQVIEASDALATLLSTIFVQGLNIHDVISAADRKLYENFVYDKSEINTTTPGFSRSNRQ